MEVCGISSTKLISLASSNSPLFHLYLSLVLLRSFRSVVKIHFWERWLYVSTFLMTRYGIVRTVMFIPFLTRPVFIPKTNREPWIFPFFPETILSRALDFMVLVVSSAVWSCRTKLTKKRSKSRFVSHCFRSICETALHYALLTRAR